MSEEEPCQLRQHRMTKT
uniref:Uncharacterized protein n=1 Tax=Arundo donax TaxID=35708 RepID=A0A0A8YRM9_ARUDO